MFVSGREVHNKLFELELSATNTEIKMFANNKSTIPVVMSTKLKSKNTLEIEVKGCQTI